jgi:hypothetical protein
MRIRTMAAAAATITLLAACSEAPDAPATAEAAADEHAEHAAAAPVAAMPRTPAPAGATVFIVSPKDGDTVTSPVQVVFGISGMALGPALEKNDNAGHHHLLVNTDLADPGVPIPNDATHVHFGKAQTEGSVELPPGQHTLQLVLGDYLHIPFDPVIASPKISVTVK